MGVIAQYRCSNCNNLFDVDKGSILNNFPINVQCPKCLNINTQRLFSSIFYDIAEGTVGNFKNGYTKVIGNQHSIIGKFKGIKIKGKKNNETN